MPPATERLECYVVVAPGLEPFATTELEAIGARDVRPHHGGVDCALTFTQLGAANLYLRTATRVLVRIARFHAAGWRDFEQGLRGIDWPRWLPADATLELSASASGSALFHTGAIEERAAAVLSRWAGTGTTQRVSIRIKRDTVTVSIDSSGEPLHRRGWRTAVDDAPLRETLAAGLLMASGWTKRAPLVDPFCGSGTIAIEAACMARRIAPGRDRSFALLHWPRAEEVRWERLIAGADDERVERIPTIAGSDISAHAIAAATANAVRAGVADDVQFTVMAADAVRLGARPGWIVTNPPYGERLRASAPAWQQLAALIERSPQWRGAVIAPRRLVDTALRAAQPVEHAHRFAVSNGGIGVELTPFRRAGERPASVVAPAPRIAAPAPPTAGGRNPSRNG